MSEPILDLRAELEQPGGLPDGWTAWSPRAELMPRLIIEERAGRRFLSVGSGGKAFCAGRIEKKVVLQGGQSYAFRVLLRVPEGANPHKHLLFAVYGLDADFNDGIFRYKRQPGGLSLGEGVVTVKGSGDVACSVRIYHRLGGDEPIEVQRLWLEPCEKPAARPVRVACTRGSGPVDLWEKVVDRAGSRGLDVLLLPEIFLRLPPESSSGPSPSLLARKAAQHRMYMAGGYYLHEADGQDYNICALFDREGKLAGRYDKHHPYSPEIDEQGVMPGSSVPVFDTDFGRVGMLVCYDSWFPDVCELLGLKGAELALFPNAGYYMGLMPARANDNNMRIVVSSLDLPIGIWDTAGRNVECPDADGTCFANSEGGFCDVDRETVEGIEILYATLDLSVSPSAHNWGGPMRSAPGGRRNRRDEWHSLAPEIAAEQARWED